MNYKYKLSLCLCIKNESTNIDFFIKHYIKQGVDHFYIINNNSSDNLEEIIEKSVFRHSITIITDNRPINIFNAYCEKNGIVAVINDNLLELLKKETEWSFLVDIDEFMFGKNGYTIKSYLNTVDEKVGTIYVIWNIMNPCKINNEITDDFFIENNVKRLNFDLINQLSHNIKNANDFGKSLVRTSMLCDIIGLHKTANIKGEIINNYGENKNIWYDNCNNINYSEENYKKLNITLNHYIIRNSKDYIKKKKDFTENIEQRNSFLRGVFEMLELDDSYFITDNYINEF